MFLLHCEDAGKTLQGLAVSRCGATEDRIRRLKPLNRCTAERCDHCLDCRLETRFVRLSAPPLPGHCPLQEYPQLH